MARRIAPIGEMSLAMPPAKFNGREKNPVTLWLESGNIERDRKQHAPRDRSSSAERNRKLDLFVSVMMILRHRLKRQ